MRPSLCQPRCDHANVCVCIRWAASAHTYKPRRYDCMELYYLSYYIMYNTLNYPANEIASVDLDIHARIRQKVSILFFIQKIIVPLSVVCSLFSRINNHLHILSRFIYTEVSTQKKSQTMYGSQGRGIILSL